MTRKIMWLAACCIVVIAMLLVSCGKTQPTTTPTTTQTTTAPTTSPTTTPTTKPTSLPTTSPTTTATVPGAVMVKDSLGRMVEKPQYGGTFTFCDNTPSLGFEPVVQSQHQAMTFQLTNENLMQCDWTKGLTGTGEASLRYMNIPSAFLYQGQLAESWEVPDNRTIIFKIRKGITWHNTAPANGREFTADDVTFTINVKWFTPGAYHYAAYPYIEKVETLDKYTTKITLKAQYAGFTGPILINAGMNVGGILPRDVYEKYGKMTDWRVACGTGAFVLKDVVEGSSETLVRNPNYWMKDPFFPENQLPYVETVKHLSIPDASTRTAAIRTGKIDHLGTYRTLVDYDDAATIMQTNPELKFYGAANGAPNSIFMRIDKPELPWSDVRVRRALSMLLDLDGLIKSYYGGFADRLSWLIPPIAENQKYYIDVKDLPAETKTFYEYHPDQAKKLLADAGFPKGFNASIVCQQQDVDILAIIQAAWAAAGVNLKLDVKEAATYVSMTQGRTHTEMVFAATSFQAQKPINVDASNRYNYSYVNDPWIQEQLLYLDNHYMDGVIYNDPKLDEPVWAKVKEVDLYSLKNMYFIQMPNARQYTFWQPWVKAYGGELASGYTNKYDFPKFIWLDQSLKAKTVK